MWKGTLAALVVSIGVILVAELGDRTTLATITLAKRRGWLGSTISIVDTVGQLT